MSKKYKHEDTVPVEVIANRLDELADAVTKGEAGYREFTMRIPAEKDRDADLVLSQAATLLRAQTDKIARIREEKPKGELMEAFHVLWGMCSGTEDYDKAAWKNVQHQIDQAGAEQFDPATKQ